ncbi:hypothetical protein [Mycobacterium sp.]|uniref:hypothetical protein n=1 Tax=Mycobacterium sp. TaxID=1785 RepID=UPI003C77CB98
MTPEQIDVWEVHEAFSAQALACRRPVEEEVLRGSDSARRDDAPTGTDAVARPVEFVARWRSTRRPGQEGRSRRL